MKRRQAIKIGHRLFRGEYVRGTTRQRAWRMFPGHVRAAIAWRRMEFAARALVDRFGGVT